MTKTNLPKIVIFGRTNVGKSTLFNCLTERKQALVSDIEGTTRDSNISEFSWRGYTFQLFDTGGIMDIKFLQSKKVKAVTIDEKVQKQSRRLIKEADLVLFVVDSKTGLLPQDKEMATALKKSFPEQKDKDKIILIANKADNFKQRIQTAEFNKLGLGEPMPISATNSSGTGDMLDVVVNNLKKRKILKAQKEQKEKEEIKVCIIGKPNVGKSSLLNALLGYERVIVSSTPHTTREPQDTVFEYNDKKIRIIDTAGISRRSKTNKKLAKFGIIKTLKVLKQADICLMVIDINDEMSHQDARIVEEIVENQKSFMIIANKWDLVDVRDTKKYTQKIKGYFPFVEWAPIHFISAKNKSKINKILDFVLKLSSERKKEISDSQLNKFLVKMVKIHRPTKAKGVKHPRIYQLYQTQTNPPKFEARIGNKDTLHNSYLRFLSNRIREQFGFEGTPIHISLKQGRQVHGAHAEHLDLE